MTQFGVRIECIIVMAALGLTGCGPATDPAQPPATDSPTVESTNLGGPPTSDLNAAPSAEARRGEASTPQLELDSNRPDLAGVGLASDQLASDQFDETDLEGLEISFNQHVAPILFETCAPCHRPGEAAPFALLTFDDAYKRADQIVSVVEDRIMPPWLPAPGKYRFRGERRLTARQIAMLRKWVQEGLVEGDARDKPRQPVFADGWQLGQPDLVVEMDRAYTLPAEGADVFRNFVIPIPTDSTKFVRAVELRPGNPVAVHHANMLIDRTPSSRRLDEKDSETGFAGMEAFGEAEIPEGHFLNWKPGTPPFEGIEGKAWRLDKGTDLIVNLHMLPTGKPEPVKVRAGFFLAERPPQGLPLEMLQLENDRFIDIPPGEAEFEIRDQFTLPVAVDVYGVYPHAHYLGKSVEGIVTFPDGTQEHLIHIPRWDFNWQAVYRFERPVSLPAGSKLTLRWVYDNTAQNQSDTTTAPKRVRAGNGTFDEMGHLWIQMLAKSTDDLFKLKEEIWRHKVEKYPQNASFVYNLGAVLENQGQLTKAAEQFARAISIDPQNAKAEHGLGMLLYRQGKYEEARQRIQKALTSQPTFSEAQINLALTNMRLGLHDQAVSDLRSLLEENENYLRAHTTLGTIEAHRGNYQEAEGHFQQALAIHPASHEALVGLGLLADKRKNPDGAADYYRRALDAKPDYVEALVNLGSLLANRDQLQEGLRLYQRALQIDPRNAEALNNVGLAIAQKGDIRRAMAYFQKAVAAEPSHTGALVNTAIVHAQAGNLSQAAEICDQVIRIDPENGDAYNQLGSICAQQQRWAEAERHFVQAARLKPDDPMIRRRLETVRQMRK